MSNPIVLYVNNKVFENGFSICFYFMETVEGNSFVNRHFQ